jgi:transposase
MAESRLDWVYSFQDETWWSRFSQPDLHSWVENGQYTKLIQQTHTKDDPDPKALACYGLLVRWKNNKTQSKEKIWLRFVEGNPCAALTIKYLQWTCSKARRLGKRVLVIFWDHASWHVSKAVIDWLRQHNRQVKQSGKGVRLLVCFLPKKSPWLNAIEPMWIHAKRKIVEPDRKLSANEVVSRVCSVFVHPVLPVMMKS